MTIDYSDIDAVVAAEIDALLSEIYNENPGLDKILDLELARHIGTVFFASGVLYEKGEER